MGFLGSFHCLGMCGPIALAFSSRDNSRFLTNRVFYNLGRTVTYTLLGLLSGLAKGVKGMLSRYLKMGGKTAFFAGGMINGLLPCGMVYIALLASLALQDPWAGGVYMFAFGVGTIPLMLALMLSGRLFSLNLRQKFLRSLPYLAVVIGMMFILRGSGLGSHYVSPQLQHFVYGTQPTEMTMCE